MPSNSKEYMKKYMQEYAKKAKEIECECGHKYKEYQKTKHLLTKKHTYGIMKEEAPNVAELLDRINKLESLYKTHLKTEQV